MNIIFIALCVYVAYMTYENIAGYISQKKADNK
jgi:hypothetical protein